jgi:hypothetical protein
MPPSKFFLRWIVSHLFAFLLSPFCFMLAGWFAMALLSVEAGALEASNSPSGGQMTIVARGLFLLAPFLTGLLLGALVSGLQSVAMRNSAVKVKPIRWVIPSMLGLGLACLAFAWTFSSLVFAYPLIMAALFSACTYGLACALPQAHLLSRQVDDSWRWLLFSLLAALLAIPLACAPVWLAEGPLYFWLVFPLAAAGGVLFGLLTGVESSRWL